MLTATTAGTDTNGRPARHTYAEGVTAARSYKRAAGQLERSRLYTPEDIHGQRKLESIMGKALAVMNAAATTV